VGSNRPPAPASPPLRLFADIAAGGLNSPEAGTSNAKDRRAQEAAEDRALIQLAQLGDLAAFRRLVERHQRRAFAVAVALVRNDDDAREIVQEAFLRAFKGLPRFQRDSTFFTWLYRIIANLGIDHVRRASAHSHAFQEERQGSTEADELEGAFLARVEGADPLDALRRREIAARLQSAFDVLPSYHQAVIVLRELEGLSYEEIAEALGVSKGTVMSRLFHARRKLQKALADCYEEQVGHAARIGISEADAQDER
jgi:RNA polymerase sigma-70 factor (ECF subfamily)